MHYANGRPAKPGDRVVSIESNVTGLIHSLNAGSTTCNARLSVSTPNDLYVTVGQCLHIDDVKAAASTLADTTGA